MTSVISLLSKSFFLFLFLLNTASSCSCARVMLGSKSSIASHSSAGFSQVTSSCSTKSTQSPTSSKEDKASLTAATGHYISPCVNAQWVVTNLRQTASPRPSSRFSWVFDRKVVEGVPEGVHVNFLKAERSLHRWALEDLQRIHAAEEVAADEGGGVKMHVLEDAGHWVHADNPDGLFRILSSSFGGPKA